jgi:hypothetical protein
VKYRCVVVLASLKQKESQGESPWTSWEQSCDEPIPHFRYARAGVPPADVLCHAGLPARLFDQEKILVSTEELFALYRGLAAASSDPAIGLKLGSEHRLERYDPLGIAAVTARSFRDALLRLARYKQLTCPEELHVAERRNERRVELRYLLAQETEPPLLVDVAFARVVDIARQGTGGLVHPKRLELRGATRNREMYEAHFGCPAKFETRHNAIVFDKVDLDRPFLTHNPDLWAMIAPQLEAELSRALASRAVGDQVKGILKRGPVADPSRATIHQAEATSSADSKESMSNIQVRRS